MPTRRHALAALAVLALAVPAGWNDPRSAPSSRAAQRAWSSGCGWPRPCGRRVFAAAAIVAMTALNQVVEQGEYPLLDDLVFFTLILGTPAVVGHLLGRRTDAHRRADGPRGGAAPRPRGGRRSRRRGGARPASRSASTTRSPTGSARCRCTRPARCASPTTSPTARSPRSARIEDAGRAALDDIRAVIGVLRAGDPLALGPLDAPDRPIPSAVSRDVRARRRPRTPRGHRRAVAPRRGDRRRGVRRVHRRDADLLQARGAGRAERPRDRRDRGAARLPPPSTAGRHRRDVRGLRAAGAAADVTRRARDPDRPAPAPAVHARRTPPAAAGARRPGDLLRGVARARAVGR